MARWEELLRVAAERPNVHAKVSGLNTATPDRHWTADDLQPAVDVALDAFGVERLVFGSDWPVALLNGTYERVQQETPVAVTRTCDEPQPILDGNAEAHLPPRGRRGTVRGGASMSATTSGRATDQAIAKIKELISSGEFTAGARLPTERELTQRFGVSRSSLREAVRALALVGVLDRASATAPT